MQGTETPVYNTMQSKFIVNFAAGREVVYSALHSRLQYSAVCSRGSVYEDVKLTKSHWRYYKEGAFEDIAQILLKWHLLLREFPLQYI